MKMRKLSMKIWIVTIIFSTVSCKVAKYNENSVTSANKNIKYTDPESSAPCTSCGNNPSLSIPLNQNPNDNSLNNFENAQNAEKGLKQNEDKNEQSNAVDPPSGKCQPGLQIYMFSNDSSIVYEPKCTRINRCGGCCDSNFRLCQPKNKTTTRFSIVRQTYTRIGVILVPTIISVEEHTSCECLCIVKQEDCTTKQQYDPKTCNCNCMNTDEQARCEQQHVLKRWNRYTCSCMCRKEKQCQTDFGFNPQSCRCEFGYIPQSIQEHNAHMRLTSPHSRYINSSYQSTESQERKTKTNHDQ